MTIRKAKLDDVEAMYELVNDYAAKGLMLSRPRNTFYENLRDFIVVEKEGELIGTGALHIMWHDLAEIRALAIKEEYTRQGIGRKMVEFLLQEAQEMNIPSVFTLTYQPGFFAKLGFTVVEKEKMPQKFWRDCINCPKFPNCDEVCMEYRFR
ncbi:MAG TPA: N-acetyltransferase [Peptococcaceae bacterium]|jgi:amino-acid N-acetyltransferase|nr:N-acetyltransferase [Clostridia bacterium]HOB82262.1 N-acetyltransferase [Peptococcaceae bacterium]HPZ70766.1 N-acetyltransferase [Peptococcaceae bacterium]HQD54036.1 N-acetyltransferase [Peptococcaceae bacterium]